VITEEKANGAGRGKRYGLLKNVMTGKKMRNWHSEKKEVKAMTDWERCEAWRKDVRPGGKM
jgi:hypothetical protein